MEFYTSELSHHGILGMKWGVRRYQNPDGTLTEAGKKRYGSYEENAQKAIEKNSDAYKRIKNTNVNSAERKVVKTFNEALNGISSDNNTIKEMTRLLDDALGKAADDQELYDMILDEVAEEYINWNVSRNEAVQNSLIEYDRMVRQRQDDIKAITNDVIQKYQDLKIDDDSLASLEINNTVRDTLDVPLYYTDSYDLSNYLLSGDNREKLKAMSNLVKDYPYKTIDEYNSHK